MTHIFFAKEFHGVKAPTQLDFSPFRTECWGDFHPSERFRTQ
jgi:hypothetical protein